MSAATSQLNELLAKAAGLRSAPENVSADIKSATVQLDAIYKQGAQAVPALAEVLLTSPEEQVRQLAAIELRKLVNRAKTKVWSKVNQQTRQDIKANLLQTLTSTTVSAGVSNGIARVIAAIARLELPLQGWPEILPWVWTSASSATPQHRETGLYTLYALIDTFVDQQGGGSFASHAPQLYQLLGNTLNDPQSLKARVLSVRILGKMIEYLEPQDETDIRAVQAMIPGLVQVSTQVLADDDETLIRQVFEVIDTLTFTDSPILQDSFTDMVQFLLQSGGNTANSAEARMAPLNSLLFLVKYKKHRVQSMHLARPIMEGLMPIGAENEPEDNDEDSPARVSFRIIDCLANNLPPAQVIDPLIQLCQQYASSSNPGLRKAAIMSLGVTFEGCSLYIVNILDQLWPFVDQCLADQDATVRKAACIALSFMCDMVGELCAKRHAVLLPHLVELINHDATRRYALNALDSLLEVLGKNIIPYLPSLMERLLALLTSVPLSVQGSVVGAIGSAAHASKTAFTPYFQPAMAQLLPFLLLTEEGDAMDLRGITQDTVGTLAEAVGKEAFAPFFQQVMHLAFEGTKIEGGNMRECSFIYFATMARVYKEDYAQFLPTLVPILLASLQQDDKSENAAVVAAAEGFDSRTETPQNGADEDDDNLYEDLDEEDLEEALLGINSALATEKETACNALDELFEHTGSAFLPYVQKSVQGFQILFEHYNEGLRKAGMTSALSFISTANKLANPPKWGASVTPEPLQADVQGLVDAIVPAVLENWQEEDDRDVATALCDTFSSVIMEVGPAVVAPKHLETICKITLDILEKKHPCQQEDSGEEVELGAEQSEWDAHLIRGAGDLVSSLSLAVGPLFAPAFNSFLPALATYVDPKRQPGERSSSIGAIAESINGLKDGVTNFTETLFQLLLGSLADADLDVRSNSAFAMGSLVFQSRQDLSSQYLTILSRLEPLFDRKTDTDDSNQACDNACGAVARLILKNGAALPLAQVLPPWLASLPIRQDFAENGKVFEALLDVLRKNAAAGQERTILDLIGQVLLQQQQASEDEKPLLAETEAKIMEYLKQLTSSDLQASGLQGFLA